MSSTPPVVFVVDDDPAVRGFLWSDETLPGRDLRGFGTPQGRASHETFSVCLCRAGRSCFV